MKKLFTEEDLRKAYKAGASQAGGDLEDFAFELWENDWISEYLEPVQEKEETVPVTFYSIKNKCGWSRYCDVTGGNHYALNEGYAPDDRDIFDIKISHARELGLI
jgi:hypothetical protein